MGRDGLAMIYCRISDDREGDALGVERQEEACRKLADQLGLQVIGVKTDNDIGASTRTAKNKLRIEYADMLRRARAGEFKHILSYSNSRITRRPLELEDLIVLHEETERSFGRGKGVLISTVVSGNDDLSTADGRMVARIKASVDTGEAERISERLKAKNQQKALKGMPAGQFRRPFGFKEDQITHDLREAKLIREAVHEIIAGASITSIRRKWERAGVLTTDGSSTWGWTPVHRVLFSWRNVGKREYRPRDGKGELQLFDAVWAPIITMEERDQALAALAVRSRKGQRQGKWLLQGVLRCGLCGRPLYGALQKSASTNSYSCTNGSTHLSIGAERLEEYITRVVFRYVLDRVVWGGHEAVEESSRVWDGQEELAETARKLTEVMDAYLAGTLSGDVVFPTVAKLEERQRELRAMRQSFYETLPPPRPAVAERSDAVRRYRRLHEQSFEDKQLTIRQEIDYIVINKGKRGVAARDYQSFKQRVEIVWRQPHPTFNGLTAEQAADTLLTLMSMPGHPSMTADDADRFVAEMRAESRARAEPNTGDGDEEPPLSGAS